MFCGAGGPEGIEDKICWVTADNDSNLITRNLLQDLPYKTFILNLAITKDGYLLNENDNNSMIRNQEWE